MAGQPKELKASLSQRHLTMIAIGGVIGAGLFVGSGAVIRETGPAAFISYALCGGLIILVMRMLGEMAVANPSTGSFADYARKALGGWAGFSTAWLYWYFWVVVVGFEAVAGADVIRFWLPDAPLWLVSFILMALMTATNLISVTSFGEFEYWFAGIKVVAIIGFLILGTLFAFGIFFDKSADFSNLWANGGFLPNGGIAVFAAMVTVIFAMVGAEIATIAAAESKDPKRAIVKATRSVMWRIMIFFVGSVFLIAVIVPWNSEQVAVSPYVTALQVIGIPGAEHIMNAVVLTAVLSCLNSGLYTASRMLFVLAGRGEAPKVLLHINRRGVPLPAILVSTLIGFVCVIFAYISPDKVFSFLLNSSGAIILFVYLLICLSQLQMRRRFGDEGLVVKMWAFPYLTIFAIIAIVAVLASMLFNPDSVSQLILSLVSFAVILVCYFVFVRGRAAAPQGEALRVLVVANKTLGAVELMQAVRDMHSGRDAQFFVCVPATPVEGLIDRAKARAVEADDRLQETLTVLASEGVNAHGELGDADPQVAVADAVAEFNPDVILVSTQTEGTVQGMPFEQLVAKLHETHGIPVKHITAHSPTVFESP